MFITFFPLKHYPIHGGSSQFNYFQISNGILVHGLNLIPLLRESNPINVDQLVFFYSILLTSWIIVLLPVIFKTNKKNNYFTCLLGGRFSIYTSIHRKYPHNFIDTRYILLYFTHDVLKSNAIISPCKVMHFLEHIINLFLVFLKPFINYNCVDIFIARKIRMDKPDCKHKAEL